MRRIVIVGVSALALAGCVVDTMDEKTGDAEQAVGSYWDDLNYAEDHQVGPRFSVLSGGSVTVETAVHWAPKFGFVCLAPAVTFVLTQRSPRVEEIGGRSFFPGGPRKRESWNSLTGGTYDVKVQTNNENAGCVLKGHVDISVKP